MSIQDIALKIKLNSARSFTRTAAIVGFIAALTVPFLMLTTGGREANNLPWYVWTLIPLLLAAVIGVGFLRFRHESHKAEDISISPDQRSRGVR